MHLRRAILLFALVLGLTAVAASVSPTRDDTSTVAAPAPAPSGQPAGALPRSVTFTAKPGAKPVVRAAQSGEHLMLSVASAEGGLASIPLLGRTASVDPSTPAQFDLIAPAAGRYDVLFSAGSVDEPERVGTLVTRP